MDDVRHGELNRADKRAFGQLRARSFKRLSMIIQQPFSFIHIALRGNKNKVVVSASELRGTREMGNIPFGNWLLGLRTEPTDNDHAQLSVLSEAFAEV